MGESRDGPTSSLRNDWRKGPLIEYTMQIATEFPPLAPDASCGGNVDNLLVSGCKCSRRHMIGQSTMALLNRRREILMVSICSKAVGRAGYLLGFSRPAVCAGLRWERSFYDQQSISYHNLRHLENSYARLKIRR